MEIRNPLKAKKPVTFRPEQIMVLGFLGIILIGSVLLTLPAAARSGQSIGYFNSLFTSTSAVCVTGLVAVDTGTTFSPFGQGILLLLIQLGGLGFVLFSTIGLVLIGGKASLKSRILMREAANSSSMTGIKGIVVKYTLLAAAIELIGAFLLSFRFIPRLGWARGVWYSVFHAVSAFCNAGFDLWGNYSSLTSFAQDPYVLLVISALIILGGLGFAVILEMTGKHFQWKEFSLHAKIVLAMSLVLTVLGWIVFAVAEWNNTGTLAYGGMGIGDKLVNTFFQSVTMRTAGFNSVNLGALTTPSKVFASILMFIGASPASTGGGVKTTTVAVVFLSVLSTVRGRNDVTFGKKRLPTELVRRAVAIFMLSFGALVLAVLLLSFTDGSKVRLSDILFEIASAVATVGVSAVGTPSLSFLGRALIIPIMFLGRVGPLTLSMALAGRQSAAESKMRYPEETIMIG